MGSARPLLLIVAGIALFAAGWWAGRSQPGPVAADAAAPAMTPMAPMPAARAPAASAVGTGSYVPPDLASATPAEVAAMRDAEVERSAASEPVATFKGIDGKPKRFAYDAGQARIAEARRQERREQLMLELQADPARFAREHHLSLKQVQWIVDGDADFPEALLEP